MACSTELMRYSQIIEFCFIRNKDLSKILGGTNHITLRVNSHESKQISTGQLLKEKKTRRPKENLEKYTLAVEEKEPHQVI